MYETEMIQDINKYEPKCGDKIFHRDTQTEALTEHLVVEEESNGYLYLLNESYRIADANKILNLGYFRKGIILIERECSVYYMALKGRD